MTNRCGFGKTQTGLFETNVPQDLLNVRIRKVIFKANFPHADSSYNPWDALMVVLEAPEVTKYMREKRIGSPTQVVPGMRPVPSPSTPHLADELDDVTVSDALDLILKALPGLWIYQDCVGADGKRMALFSIDSR